MISFTQNPTNSSLETVQTHPKTFPLHDMRHVKDGGCKKTSSGESAATAKELLQAKTHQQKLFGEIANFAIACKKTGFLPGTSSSLAGYLSARSNYIDSLRKFACAYAEEKGISLTECDVDPECLEEVLLKFESANQHWCWHDAEEKTNPLYEVTTETGATKRSTHE